MADAAGYRGRQIVMVSGCRSPADSYRFHRVEVPPGDVGRVAGGFRFNGSYPANVTCSPSGRFVAFAATAGRFRYAYVHDWVRETTARVGRIPSVPYAEVANEGMACTDGGSVYALVQRQGGYSDLCLYAIGKRPLPIGDYDQILTTRGGAYGVRTVANESVDAYRISLVPLTKSSGPEQHFTIDCASAYGDWWPSFLHEPYGLANFASSDDGEWYSARVVAGSKPPRVGLAIWRRGVEKPCYFVTSHDLRTFHMMGLAPIAAGDKS
jgi:hypothetical protein